MKSSKPVLRPLNSDTRAKQTQDNRRRSPVDQRDYINTSSPLGKAPRDRGAQSVTNQTSQKITYSEDMFGESSLSPKRPIYLNGKLLSGKRKRSVENLDPELPDQQLIEENLIEVSRSLKSLVKEYESKLREKKTLQVVVDQLKKEIQAINSQKQKVVKTQKKLENEAFRLHDMAGSKEHQRMNMMQNIERTKDEVAKLDATVQADIDQNLEMVERINQEKESLRRLQELVDRLKKEVVTSSKEKEIIRHEAVASAKMVPISEQKIKELLKDKDAFLYSVQESASVKFKNLK